MLQVIFAESCSDISNLRHDGSLILKLTSRGSLLPLRVDDGKLVLGAGLLIDLGTAGERRILKIMPLTLKSVVFSFSPFMISISMSLLFSMGQ